MSDNEHSDDEYLAQQEEEEAMADLTELKAPTTGRCFACLKKFLFIIITIALIAVLVFQIWLMSAVNE